jgi:Fe-S oxidoreductase/nitrate reductase gamma subunit
MFDPNATREIMWMIPPFMKTAMYGLLVVAMIIFLKGVKGKYDFVTQGRGLKELLPKKLQWGTFFQTLFLQGKVTRFKSIGFVHALIFYGMFVLWIATDLVAIHYDTPFKVFKGPVYIIVSFLADFAGLAVLIGVILAYKRRYIDKPEYLSSTKPKQERFMYAMLLWLVVLGFALEALRLAGQGMPIAEKMYSPIGWILATIVDSIGLSDSTLATTFRVTWFIHMVNTMLFVVSLSHSKFFHMFVLPFAALVTPKMRGAVLNPMDFEDETAETFGLGKFSELTAKNRLDLISCVECGRCTQVCPSNQAGKPLDPKLIVTKARDLIDSTVKGEVTDVDFWETQIYASNELDACTTCGACMEECPANIEHVDLILNLKRYKALTLGDLPPAAATAVTNVRNNGNPWGITQDDRMQWANGMEDEVPLAEVGKKIDYLYYVGCAGSYDDSNQKVVRDVVKLLNKAGVSFAVMGKTETCNGDPVRRFGDEYSFYEFAIQNIENMRQYDFDKVITHCPHCLHTIGKEYGKFENGQFETIHHTELLHELLRAGKLKPEKTIEESVTYHDPCYLGRHHGEYDAPREILNAIPGITTIEMEESKDRSLCCGMGGGNMWYELPEGGHLSEKRLEHVGETKASKLSTSCSYCMINFKSSKGSVNSTENIEVEDVAQTLAKSIF